MKIELITPHTHAGKLYPPGAVIDLDADAAQWLIDFGAAKKVKPAKPINPQEQ